MAALECFLCFSKFADEEADVHFSDHHGTITSAVIDGERVDSANFPEHCAQTIIDSEFEPDGENPPVDRPTSIYFSLGMSTTAFATNTHGLHSAGGVMTTREMLNLFSYATARLPDGFTLDRGHLLRTLSCYVILTDATNRTEGTGTIEIQGQATLGAVDQSGGTVLIKAHDFFTGYKSLCANFDHEGTVRRLARYLGPHIGDNLDKSIFREFDKTGTPLTKRLRIDSAEWPAALSFFAYIKDPRTWSRREAEIVDLKLRIANVNQTETRLGPSDLRPGDSTVSDQTMNRFETELLVNHNNLTPSTVIEIAERIFRGSMKAIPTRARGPSFVSASY